MRGAIRRDSRHSRAQFLRPSPHALPAPSSETARPLPSQQVPRRRDLRHLRLPPPAPTSGTRTTMGKRGRITAYMTAEAKVHGTSGVTRRHRRATQASRLVAEQVAQCGGQGVRVWVEGWTSRFEPDLGRLGRFPKTLGCHVILGKGGSFLVYNDPGAVVHYQFADASLRVVAHGKGRERGVPKVRSHAANPLLRSGRAIGRAPPPASRGVPAVHLRELAMPAAGLAWRIGMEDPSARGRRRRRRRLPG